MSAPVGSLLVLGLGNVLLGDKKTGVHLLRELERRAGQGDVTLPQETHLVDGGTLGPALLPLLAGARAVLVLDAVDLGLAPGEVTVLGREALLARVGGSRAVQPAGVGDLLAAARLAGVLPGAVALVGVQLGEIAVGLELTAAVRAALPAAVTATIDELRRLDVATAAPGSWSLERTHEGAGSAA